MFIRSPLLTDEFNVPPPFAFDLYFNRYKTMHTFMLV